MQNKSVLLSEFEYLIGFDDERVLVASKMGLLAIICDEDITKWLREYKSNANKNDNDNLYLYIHLS